MKSNSGVSEREKGGKEVEKRRQGEDNKEKEGEK